MSLGLTSPSHDCLVMLHELDRSRRHLSVDFSRQQLVVFSNCLVAIPQA